MESNNKKITDMIRRDKIPFKIIAGILFALIALISGIIYYSRWNGAQKEAALHISAVRSQDEAEGFPEAAGLAEPEAPPPENIVVYISGAVNKPGVYQLPQGGRIIDVLEMAGGAAEEADLERINLAAFATDAQQIRIPREGEELPPLLDETVAPSNEDNLININTASSVELQALPGIGPVLAGSIIDYREKNGSFNAIQDIKNVGGIGDKRFEQIESLISAE